MEDRADKRTASIWKQLPYTLRESSFENLGQRRHGKVRDSYIRDDEIFLVATDRLSAFDRVLTTIPFKGEVLTRIAAFWFKETSDIVNNHLIDVPDPSVMLVKRCDPLPIEMVVRGYLSGSLWRDYQAGNHNQYGVGIPDGMKKDEKLKEPIITPTTKAPVGEHDLPISRDKILEDSIVSEDIYRQCEDIAHQLYLRGVERAAERGLILVDTKYELGLYQGKILLMDEIHTPDSSRYWESEGYTKRFENNQPQVMLDKENMRQWLIQERNYQGDGPPPEIPDQVRVELAATYLDAYRKITGEEFDLEVGSVSNRIKKNLSGL